MFAGNSYMVSAVKQANSKIFWMKFTQSTSENGKSKYTVHTRPKDGLDWWACLHKQFRDWREETEFLLSTVVSNTKNQERKYKFVNLWAEKEARTYLNTVDPDKKNSLKTMLNTLEDWTKPKSDEVAVFTQLRALNQGNKTLSVYIQEVRRAVDLCKFNWVGDCKDRMIQNSIMAGLNSTKAYQQRISKGSILTLNECIIICQRMPHADKFKPYIQSLQIARTVHLYTN